MADPIAQLCQIIAEVLRDDPELEQAALVTRVEGAIASNPELLSALKTDERMLQINQGDAIAFQTLVKGRIAYIGPQVRMKPAQLQSLLKGVIQHLKTMPQIQQLVKGDQNQVIGNMRDHSIAIAHVDQLTLNVNQSRQDSQSLATIDFSGYLRSLLENKNDQDHQIYYTPLRVERVKPKEDRKNEEHEGSERQEQVEQLDVLEGLRKYAPKHALLVGKPGSGKSTALRRLLWEEAKNALDAIESGRSDFKIPVFIELRDRKKAAIESRIHEKLRLRTGLAIEKLEGLLLEGRFLLLFDGLNEIPTPQIWSKLREFQDKPDFCKNPRIFTTREIGTEAGLDLKEKLTLLPLIEFQMRALVENLLPGQAEILLYQLKDRLRELAETPLLLKMLCDVVKSRQGHLPGNRGELFRKEFARHYETFKARSGCISEESFLLTSLLLQHLAFKMTQGNSPTEQKLQIPRNQAIQILQNFLSAQGETDALTKASKYLKDLLAWDLLQLASDPAKIEFHHQLFQEYYAAEYLLRLLTPPDGKPGLSDDQLKRDYLNYLKWTEPIALMLSLVDDDDQALRIVKLALEVDWQLGARLAGEVRQDLQDQTVGLVNELEIPQWLKVELLGKTCSEAAFPALLKALGDPDSYLRWRAVQVFGKIGSEAAIPDLLKAIEDSDYSSGLVRGSAEEAVEVLGSIGSKKAVPGLLKALKVPSAHVRRNSNSQYGDSTGIGWDV